MLILCRKIFGSWACSTLALLVVCIAPASSQISLGSASSFAVHGRSAVTNTGPTVVNGDLGIAVGNTLIGFPPGVVVGGTFHLSDPLAMQAKIDFGNAHNAVFSSACTVNLTGLDLGGLALTPGVYCASAAQLTGSLSLDAAGNADALFIFILQGALTTATGSSIQLINGGRADNVFWRVGGSTTLGAGTRFVGNVLDVGFITLGAGASVSGRLLAIFGDVTLDSNAVAVPHAGTCPVIGLNPATLPNGVVGGLYGETVQAAGGSAPYDFAVSSGALPGGLMLDSMTGHISGTASAPGTFNFTLTGKVANGCRGSRAYSVVVADPGCPVIAVDPATLPPASIATPYSQTVSTTGGAAPIAYAISAGTLPTGLTLNSSNGTISGTPSSGGQFSFRVTTTDANGCRGGRPYSIVAPGPAGQPPAHDIPVLSRWSLVLMALLLASWATRERRIPG